MITSFLDICQKVNFRLNLYQLLIAFSVLVLSLIVVQLMKRFVCTIKKETILDERLRERRSRIARVAAEIDYPAILGEETTSLQPLIKDPEQTTAKNDDVIDNTKVSLKELDTNRLGVSDGDSKKKKTRAMSMEERWAEFDRKRASRNSA
ncbi:MAG: hypothetical protein Q8912_04525 [Bacillota bacterium]|nr:hypothetical protein [Bacillota bacterium]